MDRRLRRAYTLHRLGGPDGGCGLVGSVSPPGQEARQGGDSLELKIRSLVAEQLGVGAETVTPAAHILDDLGADSLDIVEMMMAIEEQFDIEVPDEDVEEMRTVADVERYVTGAVGAAS